MVAKAPAGMLVVVHALCVALPLRAEEAQSFRFAWVRGEGAGMCPDARTLAARVSERLGRNPFSDAGEQSIEGSVVVRDGGFHAELRVRDAGGVARGSRELGTSGSDCVELADAVVLAVALTIDPNAALGGPPVALPAPGPVPAEAPPPPAMERCPVVSCPPSAPCRQVPCPRPPLPPHGGMVARALVAAGVLPGIAPGAGVLGEVGTERLRASLGMRYFPETTTGEGRYGFGLTAGTAGVVASWLVADAVEFSALAELEVGAVHAVVYELEPVEPGDRPWVAVSVGPRLRFSGATPFWFELGTSLVVPFVRPSFEVRGVEGAVFQSAPVGGLGYLGVGLGTP